MKNKTKFLCLVVSALFLSSCSFLIPGNHSSSRSSSSSSSSQTSESSNNSSSSSNINSSSSSSNTSSSSSSSSSNHSSPSNSSSSSSSSSSDPYVPIEENDILIIEEAGEYDINSSDNYKQIYVNAPEQDVVINLNNALITNSDNSPIYVASAGSIDISAKAGTENTINDTRNIMTSDDDTQGKGAIYVADGDLKIKGSGTLNINAGYDNGIHGKDDVKVQKATLNISAPNNGIKGNDSVTILSGEINISCGGDGLKTENSDISSTGKQRGNITVSGGTLNIDSWGDGIDASYNAIIENEDPSLTIKTNKYSSYSGETVETSENTLYLRIKTNAISSYSSYTFAAYINSSWYKASYKETMQGGRSSYYVYTLDKPTDASSFTLYAFNGTTSEFSLTDYAYKSDTKAFNDNYDMLTIQSMSGSTISLGQWSNYGSSQSGEGGGWGPGGEENKDKADSSAKGIKAENEIIISGGTIDVKAYDDGIHANNDGTLENSSSPLGNVSISGGNITVDASDDGIHADYTLEISGGTINVTNGYEGLEGNIINILGGNCTVLATDDGVNVASGKSTPAINVSGGYLDVTVNSSGDTDGIDSNGSYDQTGGIVVVRGPGSASGSGGGGAFALDAENSISIKGGTCAVFGGLERTPFTSNVTRTLCSSSSVSSGNHTISFSNSSTTLSCYLKYSTNGCVVYSDMGSATLK